MKIASWNVNSIRARLPRVLDWLRDFVPDVALLQEIKCQDETFPALEIGDLGYNIAMFGQKSYNGVAILSKRPIDDVVRGLPGFEDPQARYIEASIGDLRVASLYLPNGNPAPGEKFDYKLAWMDHLKARAQALLDTEEAFVLGGDYNVIPEDDDVYDPERWRDDALFRPETRAKYREILYLGLTDAYRVLNGQGHAYTFWDYQGGAWQKDWGLRIDHLLLSPQAADRLTSSGIDKTPRGQPKTSDHTPVWCELDDQPPQLMPAENA